MPRPRILVVECTQEVSSFNPVPSTRADFLVRLGDDIPSAARRESNTVLGGALPVLHAFGEVVPSISARAPSTGPLAARDWQALREEILESIDTALARGVEAVFWSLHGAMAAEDELDPEGWLLERTRERVGAAIPIVATLDLHGILTAKMLRAVDAVAVYKTYPHVDFADTGRRGAELLRRILVDGARPVTARVPIPALVRGDELVTRTGIYGTLLAEAHQMECEGAAMAAAILIGNPFTDVPELCSQAVVTTDNDPEAASTAATALAAAFWSERARMRPKLVDLPRAVAMARASTGTTILVDAADATSSGASGDSNLILRHLMETNYPGKVLAPIVDPAAAAAAHAAGVGATLQTTIGGFHDPKRFPPLPLRAYVRALSDGQTRLETMRSPIDAGPCAVLVQGNLTVVVMSKPAFLFDRAVFHANGCDPRDHDIVVVKSPHCEPEFFDAWAERTLSVDIPGATSANLPTLGHIHCARPMFPLDEGVAFEPRTELFGR
ncbi:MAG: M81 family metallopeptidase [Armatimonadota bacterium]